MIPVSPADPFDLFNTSKLTGELLTLNCGKSNVKVARISNVYGNDFASENFVTSIIKDALNNGKIVLRTTPDSAKDYISIDDVVRGLYLISTKGNQGVYNLASGLNVKNESILNIIKEETGCVIEYSPISEQIIFPEISVEKIKRDLNFSISSTLTDNLKGIIKNIKENLIS
jgi:nucleoside-diphosphate-sugar epimerase